MSRRPGLVALAGAAGILASFSPARAGAQDTTQVREGVRLGLEYRPGVRPGLVVLPGAGLDSVRAVVQRDLDYSDRFEMIALADASSSGAGRGAAEAGAGVNYGLYKTLGAQFAVELLEAAGGITARLHDVTASQVRSQQSFALPGAADATYRLELHRVADEVA